MLKEFFFRFTLSLSFVCEFTLSPLSMYFLYKNVAHHKTNSVYKCVRCCFFFGVNSHFVSYQSERVTELWYVLLSAHNAYIIYSTYSSYVDFNGSEKENDVIKRLFRSLVRSFVWICFSFFLDSSRLLRSKYWISLFRIESPHT